MREQLRLIRAKREVFTPPHRDILLDVSETISEELALLDAEQTALNEAADAARRVSEL